MSISTDYVYNCKPVPSMFQNMHVEKKYMVEKFWLSPISFESAFVKRELIINSADTKNSDLSQRLRQRQS